jgi:hypothetical protein
MPFKQGKTPALLLTGATPLIQAKLITLCEALSAAGYEKHGGLRITRRGELLSLRNCYSPYPEGGAAEHGSLQQNHVQVVNQEDGSVAVYAHIEPYGHGLRHFISAVCDKANYGAGTLMLRRHLQEQGFTS